METTTKKGRGSDRVKTGNRRNCGRQNLGGFRLVHAEVYLPSQLVEMLGGKKETTALLRQFIASKVGELPTQPLTPPAPTGRTKTTLIAAATERIHFDKFAGGTDLEKKANFRIWAKQLFLELVRSVAP